MPRANRYPEAEGSREGRQPCEQIIAGDLIIYYEEGNPRASVSPDVFVVNGVPKHQRLIYKLWEEDLPPCFVIEVTSSSTRRTDEGKKRDLYARLGVQEYVLYDPRVPGLATRKPALEGYWLGPDGYKPMPRDADGTLASGELGLRLVLREDRLQLIDPRSGRILLSPVERADLEAERAELEAERAEREARRARAAEARIVKLEAQLRAQRSLSGDESNL